MAALERPRALRVDALQIPPALKAGSYFVNWRYEWRANKNGEWKWTKPPKRPDQRNASSTDPSTWVTFERAMRAYLAGGFDGLGRAMVPEHGMVGIDLDHARDVATGRIESWAAAYVELLDSYTEVSPSGTGLRLFIYATLPSGRKSKGGVEMYSGGRYLTLSGHRLVETRATVEPSQAALDELRRLVFGEPARRKQATAAHQSARSHGDRAELSDIDRALSYINSDPREIWFNVGAALHAELGEAGRSTWDAWSRTSSKFDESDQDATWRGFHSDRGITIGTMFRYAKLAGWPGRRTVLLYNVETGEVVEERASG